MLTVRSLHCPGQILDAWTMVITMEQKRRCRFRKCFQVWIIRPYWQIRSGRRGKHRRLPISVKRTVILSVQAPSYSPPRGLPHPLANPMFLLFPGPAKASWGIGWGQRHLMALELRGSSSLPGRSMIQSRARWVLCSQRRNPTLGSHHPEQYTSEIFWLHWTRGQHHRDHCHRN